MSSLTHKELVLPNGVTLKNRIVKAAMEEYLITEDHCPSRQLCQLYERWAKGGAGTLITGNVMVDFLAMNQAGNVCLEEDTPLDNFKSWAKAGKIKNTKMIMQLSHPGRQVLAAMNGKNLSASDVPMELGKFSSKAFSRPQPMTELEIMDVIQRFEKSALRAIEAGFDGVQIHAAHGYLLAQFLSPLTNKRTDRWGGALENRARLLIEIIKRVRSVLPKQAIVCVKLNSADFQRGGFDQNDAKQVVAMLEAQRIDFVELSGGTYESPAMLGVTKDGKTLAREAYFLEFAEEIAGATTVPVMTTGGISSLNTSERVLSQEVDLVGMGTALAFNPDLPNQWLSEPSSIANIIKSGWKNKSFSALADTAMVRRQMQRLGKHKMPKASLSPFYTLFMDQVDLIRHRYRYRKNIANHHT